MLAHKIDENGLMIEPYILDSIPTITDEDGNETPDPHYIATPCPDGFIWPRWDGAQWVEGGTAPEPVVTIDELKQQLFDTDYRIIKCYEYQMAGKDLPYDIAELHEVRQSMRDKISELEGE